MKPLTTWSLSYIVYCYIVKVFVLALDQDSLMRHPLDQTVPVSLLFFTFSRLFDSDAEYLPNPWSLGSSGYIANISSSCFLNVAVVHPLRSRMHCGILLKRRGPLKAKLLCLSVWTFADADVFTFGIRQNVPFLTVVKEESLVLGLGTWPWRIRQVYIIRYLSLRRSRE